MIHKLIIVTLCSLVSWTTWGQSNSSYNAINNNFYLYYRIIGLGSNIGSMMPAVRITGKNLSLTYEQNSYRGQKTKSPETISNVPFRETSIDSIREIVKTLKDTLIYRSNPCIMSGVVHFLTVVNGTDTINFELGNTFDFMALQIINIINEYLPISNKLTANAKLIQDEADCWRYLGLPLKKQKREK